jgi:uncharacterized protein
MRFLLLFCLLSTLVCAKPRMAIVIDDLGRSTKDCNYYAALPISLNCAVIPGMPYSRACAEIITNKKQTLLIHFPWENLGPKSAQHYPIRLTSTMTTTDIKIMFTSAFQSVPGAQGINNHMGSVLSKDHVAMQRIMNIMAKLPFKKFFLDSHTSRKTLAFDYAYAFGIPTALNNYFLDGKNNTTYIQKQFAYAVAHAEKYGSVIAICHGNRPATKRIFETCISLYNERVEFVSLTDLLKTKTRKE